jgi:hypothetical protein
MAAAAAAAAAARASGRVSPGPSPPQFAVGLMTRYKLKLKAKIQKLLPRVFQLQALKPSGFNTVSTRNLLPETWQKLQNMSTQKNPSNILCTRVS